MLRYDNYLASPRRVELMSCSEGKSVSFGENVTRFLTVMFHVIMNGRVYQIFQLEENEISF